MLLNKLAQLRRSYLRDQDTIAVTSRIKGIFEERSVRIRDIGYRDSREDGSLGNSVQFHKRGRFRHESLNLRCHR
jgi:hypothetical protein